MYLVYLCLFLLSCLVLILSAGLLVKSLSRIAAHFRVTEFFLGFVLMAFATSVPELFVGIVSAMQKNSALALGTVIGSNIADMTLVIGLATVLRKGIKIESKSIQSDVLYTFLIVLIPVILMMDHQISRIDGAILIIVFILYIVRLLGERREFHKAVTESSNHVLVKNVTIFVISFVVLFTSANFVVKYAQLLSIGLGLPPIFIGLFMIAIGTSLPELSFETKAVLTGHEYMAIGDLLGSVVANSTLVLGITALIYPIEADFVLFLSSAMFMIVTTFLFMTFVESEKSISWKEGISLILLYVLFLVVEINVHLVQKSGIL